MASVENDVSALVQKMADEVIVKIVESNASPEVKIQAMRIIFDTYADMETVSRFVLGQHWRSADRETREQFVDVFTNSIVHTWTRRFLEFAQPAMVFRFDVTRTHTSPDGRDVFVTTLVGAGDQGNPVTIMWRFSNRAPFRLVDIIVEGVSMAMTYRNEYAAILSRNNGDIAHLMEEIRSKTPPPPPAARTRGGTTGTRTRAMPADVKLFQ